MERMAQKMKKYRFSNNLGLKIIAFFFSAFLWLIVVNVDNPIGSRTFADIPVRIINDDIITSSGEVYQVIGENTVSVVVYANREVRQKLDPEDIIATADVSQMDTTTNLIPIDISIPGFGDDYDSAVAVPRNIRIQREKSGSKVLALTAETNGTTPRDGYTIGSLTADPNNVTITGPQSALDQIDRAVARVDVEGISKDTTRKADLVLYDANGNELSQTQLDNNLGEEGVSVAVEVLKEKTVPVKFGVTGTPAEGYRYTGCTSVPESIRICGTSSDTDEVDEIRVPASVISVEGASAPVEQTVDITAYLPDGISLVDENAGSITVTAMVEQEGTRTIKMLVSSARITGLAENLEVDYEPDAEITLQFRGDQQALDVLDISNAVSIDLSDYTEPGEYEVPVEVNVPDGIELISEATVNLTQDQKSHRTASEAGRAVLQDSDAVRLEDNDTQEDEI